MVISGQLYALGIMLDRPHAHELQCAAELRDHEIFDYSAPDFEQDRETLRKLRMREARP
jgi:hypothetical protein